MENKTVYCKKQTYQEPEKIRDVMHKFVTEREHVSRTCATDNKNTK